MADPPRPPSPRSQALEEARYFNNYLCDVRRPHFALSSASGELGAKIGWKGEERGWERGHERGGDAGFPLTTHAIGCLRTGGATSTPPKHHQGAPRAGGYGMAEWGEGVCTEDGFDSSTKKKKKHPPKIAGSRTAVEARDCCRPRRGRRRLRTGPWCTATTWASSSRKPHCCVPPLCRPDAMKKGGTQTEFWSGLGGCWRGSPSAGRVPRAPPERRGAGMAAGRRRSQLACCRPAYAHPRRGALGSNQNEHAIAAGGSPL